MNSWRTYFFLYSHIEISQFIYLFILGVVGWGRGLIRGLLGALVYEHGPKGAAGEGKPDRFTCWLRVTCFQAHRQVVTCVDSLELCCPNDNKMHAIQYSRMSKTSLYTIQGFSLR